MDEVTKLFQRLDEAEMRAKLLKVEIESIRTQIRTLSRNATALLLAKDQKRTKRAGDATDSSSEVNVGVKKFKQEDDLVMTEDGYVVVYTDGACENNGKANAKAGIGVWFGENHNLNIARPVIGRATNNTAEIQAPVEALKVLKGLGYKKVKIMTDSKFTINCITKWIHNWKKNSWKLASGGPVKNKEDLVKLDTIIKDFEDVKWIYIAGHKGHRGNEEADKLAREGALSYTSCRLI